MKTTHHLGPKKITDRCLMIQFSKAPAIRMATLKTIQPKTGYSREGIQNAAILEASSSTYFSCIILVWVKIGQNMSNKKPFLQHPTNSHKPLQSHATKNLAWRRLPRMVDVEFATSAGNGNLVRCLSDLKQRKQSSKLRLAAKRKIN